jgi:23S rRNA pseudouridine2605 synthase
MSDAATPGERLQKVLARAGFGSRRECEVFIVQGRVRIDGRVVRELGTRVDPDQQRIDVDGQLVRVERSTYVLLNKPRGVLTTNFDPAGRPRVVDLVAEIPQRLFSVGRLDRESEGLLLLTNDGELANGLAHPRFGVSKTYEVQVAGRPTQDDLAQLRKGIHLSEGRVSVDSVRAIGTHGQSTVLELILSEGRNREIRRMLAQLGHKVMRLRRTRIGPISDRGLRPGQHRKLTPQEVESLRRAIARPSSSRKTPRDHGSTRRRGR